ncbi:MAG: hypothetical protein LBC97_01025 [Bifidobacteriaceae bacterium]|jgi:phosphoglycerate dehydrogenase-like enzyme|nr:hypothetical protein [Bifidobacteriaceae bacterium]
MRSPLQTVLVAVFPEPVLAALQADPPPGAVVVPWDSPELTQTAVIDLAVLDPDASRAELESVAGRNVRIAQLLSAGFEAAQAALPPAIQLANAKGVYDPSVSEWALAAILAMQRNFPAEWLNQRGHAWVRQVSSSLHGQVVTIVGYGAIGQAFERFLAPFDVEVLKVDRVVRDGVHPVEDLPELARRTTILVSFLPASQSTQHLISAEVLASLPSGALVVNAGRGPVLDTAALEAELWAGRLRAALDVVETEPLPQDSTLWDAPGLFLSPHVAGQTDQAWPRRIDLVRRQIQRLVEGAEPVNLVLR